MRAKIKRHWAKNFYDLMSWRFTEEEKEIYDLLERKANKEIFLHNFNESNIDFEFSEFEKTKKYTLDISFFEHLFIPIYNIPVNIVEDTEETEETEEDIIWPYEEDYNHLDNPYDTKTNEKFYNFFEKYKSHLILFWVIVIFVLLWLNYTYQVKQQEIEKAKTELRLKDKYEILTDLDNDLNSKIDEELRSQEKIKKDLAKSIEKIKNFKAQKEKNLNDKIQLTN